MRDYEIVYIFRPSFAPGEIESRLERYHALITEGGRGEITALVQWGKRQLAYPIQKQTSGYYVVAQFAAEPEVLAGLERVLKLEDDLLRYLVVLSEGELPLPVAAPLPETTGAESAGPSPAEPADAPVPETTEAGEEVSDDATATEAEAADTEAADTEAVAEEAAAGDAEEAAGSSGDAEDEETSNEPNGEADEDEKEE